MFPSLPKNLDAFMAPDGPLAEYAKSTETLAAAIATHAETNRRLAQANYVLAESNMRLAEAMEKAAGR